MTPFAKRLPLAAVAAALATALTGCAGVRPVGNVVTERPAAVSVDAAADWAWDVSGDSAIRPAQVFTLNGKTYLQMRAGQLLPAILVAGRPVPFAISPPYIVVQGTPQRLDLIASGYRAIVIHRGPVTMPANPTVAPNRVERQDVASAPAIGHAINEPQPVTRSVFREPIVVPPPAPVAQAPTRVWRITPTQQLLSRALADWSEQAGVHLVWKSRVDVPITGAAEYRDGSFLVALSRALADASGGGYRFYFSMTAADTYSVVAVRI